MDLANARLRVTRSNGAVDVLPLSPDVVRDLDQWLKHRTPAGGDFLIVQRRALNRPEYGPRRGSESPDCAGIARTRALAANVKAFAPDDLRNAGIELVGSLCASHGWSPLAAMAFTRTKSVDRFAPYVDTVPHSLQRQLARAISQRVRGSHR